MPKHIPVMTKEVLMHLDVSSGKHYIDATFGGGGHTRAILENSAPGGFVFAIDLDQDAVMQGRKLEKEFSNRLKVVYGNYKNFPLLLREHNIMHEFSGIVCDLGYSSLQIDDPRQGFSFQFEGPLDMRFSKDTNLTAEEIVNTYSPEKLTQIFREYADEALAKPIAKELVKNRPFYKTKELATCIEQVYGRFYQKKSIKHPATKVFQALRMEVNQEVTNIQEFLEQCISYLPSKAIIAIITFHSIEDRIVKQFFARESKKCICKSYIPVCICEHQKRIELITKKPILPSKEEMEFNKRSRTAKLRVAQKI